MLLSSKCRRRRKPIGNITWSVTIRTGRQYWTQPVARSENSYSFMIFQPGVQQTIFDSQQLHRKFWLSRTLPSNFFSTKRVAKNKQSKAEGKWRRHSNWKKEARGTNLDISRLQANLAVLSTRGEHKQKTKTNELSENDGRGIAGCLDLSTAKIQAGVAGHQFHPECYCYSGRTASCWVWTCNRTGAVRSEPKSGHQQLYDIGIWIHEHQNSPQNECHHQCHAAACYDDFGWPNCRELMLWNAFCAFDGPTMWCLIKQAMEHLLGIGAALLRQHRLNATCSNHLLTPVKPHAHILMYKSAAASVSTHEKQLQVQKIPAKNFAFCLPGPGTAQMPCHNRLKHCKTCWDELG